MKKRILLTGGGGAGTEALWRFLSDKYDLYFADADIASIIDVIPAERKIQLPFAADANFIETVKNVCRQYKIDILVPGVDEELYLIALHREDISANVLLPSSEFVKLMLDKQDCAKALEIAGLPVPPTLSVSRASEIGFPLIVKPRSGRGSRGVSVLRNLEEIAAYKVMNRISDESTLVAQKLCVGDEYTVLVAADVDGKLAAVIPVKVEQKKGITIKAQTESDKRIHEYVEKFHAHFKQSGIYNIQCILTEDGSVMPFEVNPRVSTTFCLGVASGFDPFSSFLKAGEKVFTPENTFYLKRNWTNNIWTD